MMILCIGGCMDAQWIDVHDENPYVHVPVPVKMPDFSEYIDNQTKSIAMERETYKRRALRTSETKFEFLLEENLCIEDALQLLLDNYRPASLYK